MAEFEELKLVVTLTDHASAGINNFQKSVREFSSGQSATHLENFKRHNSFMTQALKATGLEATGASKAFIELGGRFVAGAAIIGGIGYAVYKATSMVNDAAQHIVRTARQFKAIGVEYGEAKQIVEQYEKLGMTAEQANANIRAAAEIRHQMLLRGGIQMFQDLQKAFGRQEGGESIIEEFREAVRSAKDMREILNASEVAQSKLDALARKSHSTETKEQQDLAAAHNRQRFREATGYNEAFDLAERLDELDQARTDRLNKLNEQAEKFAKTWDTIAVNIGRIGGALEGEAIKQFLPLLESVKDASQAIFQLTTDGMKVLQDKNWWKLFLGEDANAFNSWDDFGRHLYGKSLWEKMRGLGDSMMKPTAPHNFGLDQAQPFLSMPGVGGGSDGNEKLDDNTRELKRLNDNLYRLLNPEGNQTPPTPMAKGGIVTKPTVTMLGEAGPEAVIPLPRSRPTNPALAWEDLHNRLKDAPNLSKFLSYGESDPLPGAGSNPLGYKESIFEHLKDAEKEYEGPTLPESHFNVHPRQSYPRDYKFDPETGKPVGQPISLRAMAEGGVVDKPTMALIGEKGPEAVIPLSRQVAGIAAIGASETGFSRKEAYSEFYNSPNKGPGHNANVEKYGQAGADYGYFQMNQMQAEAAAAKYGLDAATAKHLYGGGRGGSSSIEEQSSAVFEYVKAKYPKQFEALGKTGDFNAFRKALSKEWFGLSRHGGKEATQAFNDTMGTMNVDPSRSRAIMDSAGRGRQQIDAGGHIKVQVGKQSSLGSQPSSLFKPIPEQQMVQMAPASIGPSERVQSGPPTLAGGQVA